MKYVNRRQFLSHLGRGALGVTMGNLAYHLSSAMGRYSPNEVVNLALIGCGGRGLNVVQNFVKRDDVRVVYFCDLKDGEGREEFEQLKKSHNRQIRYVKKYQQVLDDKGVDAVLIATPDHWHGALTVYACQAGKDVYVEKPPSHNIWEGRKMVEAARKYNRIVQVGTQNRSAPYVQKALEYIQNDRLGAVHLCKVFNLLDSRFFKLGPNGEPPEGFDWNTWLGPASARPYNYDIWNGAWHKYWAYSGGLLADDGIHQLDIARMLVGKDYPNAVQSSGGNYAFKDEREVPDTQVINYDFNDLVMTYDQTHYTPYMSKTPGSIRFSRSKFPSWLTNSTRIELYGTKGVMILGRHGGGWQVYGEDGKIAAQEYGYKPDEVHIADFIQSIKKRTSPSADIEEGHRSAVMVHLGNISIRMGSARLTFDKQTETIVGNSKANKLIKRQYRSPYVIPEHV